MSTVLIVDDEYAVLRALARELEAAGHDVVCAGNGAEALDILARGGVDVVLCDATMPVINGAALLSYMRGHASLRTVPFVMMAHSHELVPDHSIAVLRKPVRRTELLALVRQALGE